MENNVNPAFYATLYAVLRDHGTGQLKDRPAEQLQSYQTVLTARIDGLNTQLTTTNTLKNVASELRSDVRWFSLISDEIGQLLTAEVHQK